MSEDRFERQRELVPGDRLADLAATVIGVGSIGRQVAIQLASIGVPRLRLIDFDIVESSNITTQGYLQTDCGTAKVTALSAHLHAIDPTIDITAIHDRYRPAIDVDPVVFCSVDSISARTAIWRSVSPGCRFWCDGRMRGETLRILTAADEVGRSGYASSLFPQSEAQAGSCTSRSIIYAAAVATGLMVHQFTRWLRDLPVDYDTSVNLLASEWTAV